jgi:hypothetical protein
MGVESGQAVEAFTPGQLWRIENGYILITEQGKRFVGYKKLRKVNQRAVVTQLIRPDALMTFLRQVEAELVREGGI